MLYFGQKILETCCLKCSGFSWSKSNGMITTSLKLPKSITFLEEGDVFGFFFLLLFIYG